MNTEMTTRETELLAANAALELEVVRLRECLEWALCNISAEPFEWCCDEDSTAHYAAIAALSTPFTPTALSAMIAKVSGVMRERCRVELKRLDYWYSADAIRAIPNVTLEKML